MNGESIIKSSQEQAVAAWINQLNQLRLSELLAKLSTQDNNLENALCELKKARIAIDQLIGINRGGSKGVHGFIAEVSEVGIQNAKKLITGAKPECVWVNNNGPADIVRAGVEIQQKFVNAGGHFGLEAILKHFESYPDFIQNGGKYQIPKDFYDNIQKILSITEDEGKKLTKTSVPTKAQWEWINNFFQKGSVHLDDIEPAQLDYSAVQSEKVYETLEREKENLKDTAQEYRDEAYRASKPTRKEGIQATAVSAVVEGGMNFCLSVAKKLKSGKQLGDFTAEDWKDVGIDTTKGVAAGGIRGATVYAMSNFTATPAAVANSLVTAAFGVASQANQLKEGTISEEDFIVNSEVICLEVSVSAIAALLGQVVIPVPVLGAVIGNTVGMFMYQLAKDNLNEKEQTLIVNFKTSYDELNQRLEERYQKLIEKLKQEFAKFTSMVALAFDLDVNVRFAGSLALAQYVGVPAEKILMTREEIDYYFTK